MIEDQIQEHLMMPIVVPENDLEADFVSEWIRKDLKDDLGGVEVEDHDVLAKFFRTVSYIRHNKGGQFLFDHSTSGWPSMGEGFCFYVHPYRPPFDPDLPSPPMEFELIWVKQGVGYSLYESSIIEDLMRCLK